MKNAKLNWVRLPLDSLENCRDLGGYNTKNNEQTKWRSFLRSDNMSKLTQEEITFLKEYGVKTVIDLRGEDETQIYKNPLAEMEFCDYHNIPLMGQPATEMNLSPSQEHFMGDFYVKLLEETAAVKQIFDTIAQAKEGCIVFHCMAGKDRTGIVAMLLLGLAGVEKKDIISNYEVTYTNLESLQKYKDLPESVPKSFLFSSREYILRAYEHILQNYGSCDNYLLEKGVESEVIDRVKERLLGVSEPIVS